MKLKALLTAEEFEALAEDLRENYTTEGGEGHRLTVDGLEEVSGLKSALQKERQNARAAGAQAKTLKEQLESSNEDPEELTEARAKATALEKNFTALSKTLTSLVRDKSISEAITEHRAFPELGPAYLRDKVRVEVDARTNEVSAFVEHAGERLTVSAYTKKLFEATSDAAHPLHTDGLARLFQPTGHSGGGTPPKSANTPANKNLTIPVKPRSRMSTSEKVAFIKANGEDQFMRLPS